MTACVTIIEMAAERLVALRSNPNYRRRSDGFVSGMAYEEPTEFDVAVAGLTEEA
jgi:hypothetical protein